MFAQQIAPEESLGVTRHEGNIAPALLLAAPFRRGGRLSPRYPWPGKSAKPQNFQVASTQVRTSRRGLNEIPNMHMACPVEYLGVNCYKTGPIIRQGFYLFLSNVIQLGGIKKLFFCLNPHYFSNKISLFWISQRKSTTFKSYNFLKFKHIDSKNSDNW